MSYSRTLKIGSIAAKGYLGLIYTLLYLPIIVLVVMSFNKSKIGYNWGGFSLKWYESLFNNQAMLDAFWHSIVLGLVAATVSTLIGTLTALALHRYNFRGKGCSSMTSLLRRSKVIVSFRYARH